MQNTFIKNNQFLTNNVNIVYYKCIKTEEDQETIEQPGMKGKGNLKWNYGVLLHVPISHKECKHCVLQACTNKKLHI